MKKFLETIAWKVKLFCAVAKNDFRIAKMKVRMAKIKLEMRRYERMLAKLSEND